MDFEQINQKLRNEMLTLKPISQNDRAFINEMFQDSDIKKNYIIPKEAQQDYRRLVDYWLNDNNKGAGTCWIIFEKGSGIFSNDKQVGFIAFDFRDTLKNARISYAILPNYRRKGIATSAVKLVIDNLKSQGIERIEADIDRDNLHSEGVVKNLGFQVNKRHGLIDPEMLRDGEIKMRALWKKELVEFDPEKTSGRIPLNATLNQVIPLLNQIVEEINTKGQHPNLLVRYFYLLGRVKYLEGNFEEAQSSFGQSNMITMNESISSIHENYYWFGKINEAKGDKINAKMYYGIALEKFNDNPDYITKKEIEREMNK
jgi:RimJ/RimL family protein N-acetyltransferase